MKDLAILEYSFLIDPSETWTNAAQFESTFNDFLVNRGMVAKIVTSVGTQAGRRVLYICKKPDLLTPDKDKKYNPKVQLKNVGRK